MRCKKAKKLISLYLAPDESCLSPEDRQALEAHMAVCEPCREDCREGREVIGVLQKCWKVSEDTAALLEKGRQGNPHRISARIIKLHGAFRRVAVGAAAACLAIAVLIGLVSTNREAVLTGPNHSVALTGENPSLVIKSADGGHIAPGTDIQTSAGQIRNLVLNGRHRVVMNAGTRLSIRSLLEADRAGCLVRLALGEVYVHVEHDGNPFAIQTPHGRVVITGTTFDVKATDTSTTLVVAEGSVRFESEKGLVEVASGQISKIIAQSVPTSPVSCNTIELTAWATGSKPVPILDQAMLAQEAYDITDLLLVTPEPMSLESVDYEQWVEQKREWFTQQFPWIFVLQKALTTDDRRLTTDIDYPELLISSGDIWQIVYPERFYRIIPTIDPNLLLTVAEECKLANTWRSEVVASADWNHLKQNDMAFGKAALDKWLADCRRIQKSYDDWKSAESVWEHSLALGEFLENTRALIWLCIQNDILKVPSEKKTEILLLLQEQVIAAYTCKKSTWHLSLSTIADCSDRESHLRKLIKAIESITDYEQQINEVFNCELRSVNWFMP
ncbi:MAG: hypothetical protein GY774_05475 [Planctomycetes bacterium]|nr:hypothetical protein [Planctomycetota bacterium]